MNALNIKNILLFRRWKINILASKIQIQTMDDVNQILRENEFLQAELCVTDKNEYIIIPTLSTTIWDYYPYQKNTKNTDFNWEHTIIKATKFLQETYNSTATLPKWIDISAIYRCPKQESFVRNYDLL